MLHERVKEIRSLLKLSQAEFGRRLGVSRDVIANIEYNRARPQNIFIQHMCSTFSVNPRWLETGEGDVFIHTSENLKEAMRLFRSLSPELQTYALKQIRNLLEFQEGTLGF